MIRRTRPALHHASRTVLMLGCLAGLWACGEAPPGMASSALLITLDTTRADALSCYGAAFGVTPALDRLAAEGVRFEAAYAAAPLTLPSHASMLTGLYPPRHTLRNNGMGALPAAADSLAELARASGRQTAAFIGAVVLDQAFGLDQGFDTYDTPFRTVHRDTVDYTERPGAAVMDAALAWFGKRDKARPFFLWVHLFDPHGPHQPPPGFRNHGSDYLGEVAAADHEVGRLIDALRADGALESTTVLVVGDHGEGLGDHGEVSHGTYCYDTTMRVPMILRRSDGKRSGERETGITSVVDVYPTLMEAMGLSPSPGIDGISLLHDEIPAGRGVYFESYYGYLSYGWSPITGWVDADGKYLHSSEPEFYDLAGDPTESRNLALERADLVERSQKAILSLAGESAIPREADPEMDPELLAQISRLGYTAGSKGEGDLPGLLFGSDLPSPRRMAAEDHEFRLAQQKLARGEELPQAEESLRAILAANPRHFEARDVLGRCLMLQNRHQEALAILRTVVDEGPPWPQTHLNIAICLIKLGRPEEAIAPLRHALEIDSRDAQSLGNLVFTLESLGRHAEAAPYRQRFLEQTGKPLPARR
ncbi:MAG: sulfatase-like hydrolase/transferase [Planctomycetota bacterium]